MTQTITVIPGDGIGPEITEAVLLILGTADVDYEWEIRPAGLAALEGYSELLPQRTLNSILKNKVFLKGPLTTPIGEGFQSVNVQLRQRFDLFANIRPAQSFEGIKSPYKGVDIVLFRENVEGEYCGKEEVLHTSGGAENGARMTYEVTRHGCFRIVQEAFVYARKNLRRKVTLVHKANIMKLTQGLMLQTGQELAVHYPDIEFETMIVDNCCHQLVRDPTRFDVMVMSNLFGDIISDLNAGLVGGLGLTGSANIGDQYAMFEAVHGSAPDIAGKGVANPTSLLLSAVMMLQYLGNPVPAQRIKIALYKTLLEGGEFTTRDIGGTGDTVAFTNRLIQHLQG